ncbi:hypothetical protein ASPCAL00143 [Aspergillus calidoustus]|uniref:Uncharacterized protein n=1 Tax=Aspergillus calidoustus TaxID=454130 RepID=A0A0U5FMB2_ASPCI|nr:hypothetical protein ASPCAL00143 [Aspergillus calidoustus]
MRASPLGLLGFGELREVQVTVKRLATILPTNVEGLEAEVDAQSEDYFDSSAEENSIAIRKTWKGSLTSFWTNSCSKKSTPNPTLNVKGVVESSGLGRFWKQISLPNLRRFGRVV